MIVVLMGIASMDITPNRITHGNFSPHEVLIHLKYNIKNILNGL